MFKQDEIDVDNKSMRKNELDQINNGIKLLSEMLNEYDKKKSNLSEKETIKYLYDEIERMQPKIIELAAAETEEENTDSIKQVLNASDQCQSVMDKFKKLFSPNNAYNSDDDLINICTNNELNTDDNNVKNNVHTSLKDLEDLFFSSSETKSNSTINNDLLLNLNDLSFMKPQVIESKPAIKNSIETGSSLSIYLSRVHLRTNLDRTKMEQR